MSLTRAASTLPASTASRRTSILPLLTVPSESSSSTSSSSVAVPVSYYTSTNYTFSPGYGQVDPSLVSVLNPNFLSSSRSSHRDATPISSSPPLTPQHNSSRGPPSFEFGPYGFRTQLSSSATATTGSFPSLSSSFSSCSSGSSSSYFAPSVLLATRIAAYVGQRAYSADMIASDGESPLMQSVKKGNYNDVVQLIQSDGVDVVRYTDLYGNPPLLVAARNGNFNLVQLLLSHRVNVNQCNESTGYTALMLAALCDHTDIVQLLLQQHQATTSGRNYLGDDVYTMACAVGSVASLSLLCHYDPRWSVERFQSDGLLLQLFLAAFYGFHFKCIRVMASYGAVHPVIPTGTLVTTQIGQLNTNDRKLMTVKHYHEHLVEGRKCYTKKLDINASELVAATIDWTEPFPVALMCIIIDFVKEVRRKSKTSLASLLSGREAEILAADDQASAQQSDDEDGDDDEEGGGDYDDDGGSGAATTSATLADSLLSFRRGNSSDSFPNGVVAMPSSLSPSSSAALTKLLPSLSLSSSSLSAPSNSSPTSVRGSSLSRILIPSSVVGSLVEAPPSSQLGNLQSTMSSYNLGRRAPSVSSNVSSSFSSLSPTTPVAISATSPNSVFLGELATTPPSPSAPGSSALSATTFSSSSQPNNHRHRNGSGRKISIIGPNGGSVGLLSDTNGASPPVVRLSRGSVVTLSSLTLNLQAPADASEETAVGRRGTDDDNDED